MMLEVERTHARGWLGPSILGIHVDKALLQQCVALFRRFKSWDNHYRTLRGWILQKHAGGQCTCENLQVCVGLAALHLVVWSSGSPHFALLGPGTTQTQSPPRERPSW